MPTQTARVIIPLAVIVWLLFILIFTVEVSPVVTGAVIAGVVLAIPLTVFYLMSAMGWAQLARRFRRVNDFAGAWQPCPTAHMALVGVDHPQYGRNQMRFVGTLRVGLAGHALYLSTPMARVPLLGRFFPDLELPWSAFTSARSFEAPGWVASNPQGGSLQATYDPNYTGAFIELQIGDPPVFLQLPQAILGDSLSRLPLARSS